jgi:hypothetical protein
MPGLKYTPPVRYTPEELRAALIADLESDLEFSRRTDPPTSEWVAYQDRISTDLANLRAGGKDARL